MKQAFQIDIDESVLTDLRARIRATRWIDEIDHAGWKLGTNKKYLQELCDYWAELFNWKKVESYLNTFDHYKADVAGTGIHFIFQPGKGKIRIPLLLLHGYPDGFVRYLKIIPLLTRADEQGVSFDVIAPSNPGYGFSDIPRKSGMNTKKIAQLFHELMTTELGYASYAAHGGDTGSALCEQLALYHKESVLGIHLTDLPFQHLLSAPDDASGTEKKFFDSLQTKQQQEGAYALIQSTKPQSLAYGMNDSPAGLAGWIIEKFYAWSDHDGNLESIFTKDELLTNISIYWITQTINSAFRLYYETIKEIMNAKYNPLVKLNPLDKTGDKVEVPTGFAIFHKDMAFPPRELAERFFTISRWTEMTAGGHFAAMEKPEVLAGDIREFFLDLNHEQHSETMATEHTSIVDMHR
jgi:pimeloyl-ACP methyl ester carboxylesterase